MVLTGYGKQQLSRGELEFVYWVPFDDEVDYNPYNANSGSLTDSQLSASITQAIEDCLVQEATTGYQHLDPAGKDTTYVHRPLFDMPQGQRNLPRALIAPHVQEVELETKQRKTVETYTKRDAKGKVIEQIGPIDRGTERFGAERIDLELGYRPGDFPDEHKYEGFRIMVFQSGSTGLKEIDGRRDLNNELAFNNDLKYIGES